jgi:C-terminal processing protease CtpA/Prc
LHNKEKILQTENLIIDLRNNDGGSDRSFREILPYIYTNPMRIVGLEFRSTKLNNQRMLDFINKPEYGFDEAGKKWAKEQYDKLEKRLGQFVNLESSVVSIDTMKTMYPTPKNVGIIINEVNASTTEQFLLAAKQSKKVKLFGTTTFGLLDVSNVYAVKSPCNEFEIYYSLSRSMRIPEMTIDNKGIQPDYYIDKSVPQYKWVDFVNEILNTK